MTRYILAALVAASTAAPLTAQHGSSLPFKIPQFCETQTGETVAAGTTDVWADAVERGVVCVAGVVEVRPGARVRYDTILVLPGGALRVASAKLGEAAIDLVRKDIPIDTGADPEQWGGGIVVVDGTLELLGQPKTTWLRLTGNPKAGDTALTLERVPEGWAIGDRIVIPDTRQLPVWKDRAPTDPANGPDRPAPEWEERRIARVDGAVVTLDAPLTFAHAGPFTPHVGNLSRSVVVRSENPAGTRGHILVTGRSTVRVEYARLYGLGRTTNQPLHSTALDERGEVVRLGTNQIGRYPVHLHHLVGFGWRLVGNAVENNVKWGLTAHNSHDGLIADNVVYDTQGGGIVTEQGNEARIVIERNFVVRVRSGRGTDRGGADGVTAFGQDGSCFWFRGPYNYVRDNVAANCSFYGFNYNGYFNGPAKLPIRPGADSTQAGEYELWPGPKRERGNLPTLESARNEVYGYGRGGLWVSWPSGTLDPAEAYLNPTVFTDYRIWHMTTRCVESYHTNRSEFSRIDCVNDPTVKNQGGNRFNIAMDFSAYESGCLRVRDASIVGYDYGLNLPGAGVQADDCPHALIERVTIRDTTIPIVDRVSGNGKSTTLRDVTLVSGKTATPGLAPRLIAFSDARPKDVPLMGVTRLLLQRVSLNGEIVSGEAWHKWQSPTFEVWEHKNPEIGVPEGGLTTVEALAKYGRTPGGRIAPASAVPRADSDGLYGPQTEPGPFDAEPIDPCVASPLTITVTPTKIESSHALARLTLTAKGYEATDTRGCAATGTR